MRTIFRFRTVAAVAAAGAVAATLSTFASAAAPRFFDDDPVWVDRDSESAAGIESLEVDLVTDLATNLVLGSKPQDLVRARNVNTVDEVPDSSWYTNRLGRLPLTPEDVGRGPDKTNGPAAGQWTVTSSKSDGVTPGFTIKDANGQLWFLKFDPRGYRGMATGTEVTVTKLMWALGYNVPENHIAYLRREQLVVGESARFTPESGRTRQMRASDIDRLLDDVDREPDGRYRVVASRALDGTPVGRIRFYDTRPDDPNDIVPHQHRRELRGYGVFAAWLNHVDAKAINSLDTLVTENGRSYIKHNLIDFGSALGSGGVAPADYWAGTQYLVDPKLTARQIVRFGFAVPRLQTANFYESRSIGRLPEDNSEFDPRTWKPRVPNQAFLHARADDQFWAARRLSAMTTDMIRAAVKAGEFGDPDSEEFLVRALAERRDAIVGIYLTAINPIESPALDADNRLTFRNAAVDTDMAHAPRSYHAVWSEFDNATGDTRFIGTTESPKPVMAAPAELPRHPGGFVKIALSSSGSDYPSWSYPVDAYFRYRNAEWQLVGFERMPDAQ